MAAHNDNGAAFTDLVSITVGRLAGRPGTWVVIDNAGLIYVELSSREEACASARRAAAALTAEGFRVTIDDPSVPA